MSYRLNRQREVSCSGGSWNRNGNVLGDGDREREETSADELLLGSLSEIDVIEERLLVLRRSISATLQRLARDRTFCLKPSTIREPARQEAPPRPPTSTAEIRPRLVRLPEVIIRIGLTRSTIYSLMQRGKFPRQVRLTPRTVGWWEPDLDQWIKSRLAGIE